MTGDLASRHGLRVGFADGAESLQKHTKVKADLFELAMQRNDAMDADSMDLTVPIERAQDILRKMVLLRSLAFARSLASCVTRCIGACAAHKR